MKAKDKASLTIRVIEWANEHESFKLSELFEALTINTSTEMNYVDNILAAKTVDPNPNNILGVSDPNYRGASGIINRQKSKYSLLPTAWFSYVDLQEVQIARENAEFAKANAIEANRKSMIAIYLSAAAMIISSVIGVIQIYIAL
jgi:hypothetical protein